MHIYLAIYLHAYHTDLYVCMYVFVFLFVWHYETLELSISLAFYLRCASFYCRILRPDLDLWNESSQREHQNKTCSWNLKPDDFRCKCQPEMPCPVRKCLLKSHLPTIWSALKKLFISLTRFHNIFKIKLIITINLHYPMEKKLLRETPFGCEVYIDLLVLMTSEEWVLSFTCNPFISHEWWKDTVKLHNWGHIKPRPCFYLVLCYCTAGHGIKSRCRRCKQSINPIYKTRNTILTHIWLALIHAVKRWYTFFINFVLTETNANIKLVSGWYI